MKQPTAIICLSKVNGGMELASVKLTKLLSNDTNTHFIGRHNGFIHKETNTLFQNFNVKTHFLDFKSNFSLKLISKVRHLLIQNNIKNVIFLGASEMKSLYFATKGLDINFIIRQGSKKTTSKKDFFHRLFYSNVNHYVGNCEYMKQNIIDILPISKQARVHRIYSSVRLPQEVNYKEDTSVLNIIHLGRINPGKGQLQAIQGCEVLHQHNIAFKMTFLGDFQDKEYYATIESYLEKQPFKESIHFVGYTNNIKEYLENSDVYLFPSLGEGMSNAIIESLGYGLIPIIYNDTSSPEFKTLGFHVHLTEHNDVATLKELLLKTAQNFYAEKKEGQKNHKKALEIFALQREREST